ncbi:MAG TPA: AraC family transcriptional regulator, partial [Pseudomonas sp.]|nr:AraC family transcriptional regulator [Pseudomonas sp.]
MLQLTEARRQAPTVLRIGFWLTEAFDFYSLANALEPLRLANETAGQAVCQWQILSLHGHPLKASNGISTATAPLQRAQPLDVLILCAADDLQASGECAEVSRHLQHWAAQPVGLGALGKSGWLLARLGELDNLKCSLPEPDPSWALASFARLKPVPAPFCIDAGRLTCVGA